MTRATIHDANLPFNVWDFVVDHMTLVDSMTTYATHDPSKTIFESVYSAIPSFDSMPPVGCFGVRLECEKPSSYKLGSKNTSGIFLGYSFLNGIYGAVLLTGKGSYVVGKQQMAFDVNYFPLKDCGKTHPHLSTLYRVLGRIPSPAQLTNPSTSRSGKSDSEDDAVQPSIEEFDAREQAGRVNDHLSSRIEIEDSSDDELVQEVVYEMKDVVNGISAFNPLGSEQRLLPIPTDLISNRNADENEIDVIDESQGVNSTLDKSHASLSGQYVKSARKNIRSLPLKNVHSNEPNPSHLSKTNSVPNVKTLRNISMESLLTNKTIIYGKKVKVPFPGLGNFICKIEKYNPASNTYTLSHPDGDWANDMIFDDVVKLIPKSCLAEEHKAHVNAISCTCEGYCGQG